jgi:hypothetical protein
METKKLDQGLSFFSRQLSSETKETLLKLDLANNPEAEKHLILFLKAMWIEPDEMKPLLESLKKRQLMKDFLESSSESLSKAIKDDIAYFANK